jgi:hypothetical protein
MSNHFHLVVETPRANLVAGMKWLLGTYTMRFNRRHKLSGHLFAGRYKSLLVDGAAAGYLRTVCDYVHLNPVRARLLGKRGAIAKVQVEQLSKLFAKQTKTGALAALRPFVRRAWPEEGESTLPIGICSQNGAAPNAGKGVSPNY